MAVVGAGVVMASMILYVSVLLNRFKKVSAVEALRFSGGNEKIHTKTRGSLQKFLFLSPNVRIGLIDSLNRKALYGTMLLVFILATFIMIVPALVYHTTSSEAFVESIGFGRGIDISTSL
jgi:putative ABC transport system permease protein